MVSTEPTLSFASDSVARRRLMGVWFVLLLIGVAILALYWPTVAWLVSEWSPTNARFSHGYLLAAISVFLIGHSARNLSIEAAYPRWWALSLVLLLSFVWLLGYSANVVVVHTLVVPLIGLAAIFTALGPRIARQMAFSVMYIGFALPVWEYLQPFFQALTIEVVTFLVDVSGVPAHIVGSVVELPYGSFRISGGCSGVIFIMVGLALSALYGYLYYRSPGLRWRLAGIAFVLVLLMNWVRVTTIILIGYATEMQSSIVNDHHAFGWALFAVALIPMLVVARRLERHDGGQLQVDPIAPRLPRLRTMAAATSFVIVALGSGPVWAVLISQGRDDVIPAEITLPEDLAGWQGPASVVSNWQPVFHGPTTEVLALYTSEFGPVCVYSNLYARDDQDNELIFTHNRIEGEFRRVKATSGITDLRDETRVRSLVADDGFSRWQIFYWYEVDGHRETSEMKIKLRQALASVRGRQGAGTFAVAARCADDCAGAAERIHRFLEAASGKLWLEHAVSRAGGKAQ